jgi:hypothetical protein
MVCSGKYQASMATAKVYSKGKELNPLSEGQNRGCHQFAERAQG